QKMSHVSEIDVTEQMRQMTLNRLVDYFEAHKRDNINTKDNCLFLALPNKLIGRVLSYLPPKDRLRARVSKKLNAIEAESKYYVKELTIAEVHSDYWHMQSRCFPDFFFSEHNPYSFDCIRRICTSA
ncbi:hypothetical protein PMAYCL1PPCAC_00537, partial [Pristionchus mayeri]